MCTFTPIYAAPLSKDAWAVTGMTLPNQHYFKYLRNRKYTHLWLRNTLDRLCPVAMGLDCHNNGLRPTRCHRACTVRVVIKPETHRHNLGLHLSNCRKYVGMQRVRDHVSLTRSENHMG